MSGGHSQKFDILTFLAGIGWITWDHDYLAAFELCRWFLEEEKHWPRAPGCWLSVAHARKQVTWIFNLALPPKNSRPVMGDLYRSCLIYIQSIPTKNMKRSSNTSIQLALLFVSTWPVTKPETVKHLEGNNPGRRDPYVCQKRCFGNLKVGNYPGRALSFRAKSLP